MSADPKALAQQRFADPQPLVTSIDVIGRCATDPPLVTHGLLDAIAERAGVGARVLEVGFGSGWLLESMLEQRAEYGIHALDLSVAQTRRAAGLYPGIEFAVGDMERLPFRDAAFDVIVTCWTLYFARDIDAALAEFTRCLSPGGRLIAAASVPDHEAEAVPLMTEAVHRALDRELHEPDVGARFDLDTGRAHVERYFSHVDLRLWPG
jgi:ubiquinone/menaquinone biosynthesis C-methylase UbiE